MFHLSQHRPAYMLRISLLVVQTLYRVLMDFPSYPKWYWQVKSSVAGAAHSQGLLILYGDRAPFDLRDRDVILHATLSRARKVIACHRH